MLDKLRGMFTGRASGSDDALATAEFSQGRPPVSVSVERPHPLDRLRFAPERELLEDLFQRFGLEDIIAHIVDSGEIVPYHQMLLSQQVRLTPLIAPRLFSLFSRVCDRLSFHEPADLYVFPSDRINAAALHRLSDDQPHAVSLTSAAVRDMTDDELCFVLGHEVGHLHFRHYRVMTVYHMIGGEGNTDEGERKRRIPQLLERRLDTWGRLAELSVDRVGYLAAGESLQTAVGCFYKMASGLGPEHLKFDVGAFLAHLERLESMPRKEVMSQFSHPVTPVRARALQLYSLAKASGEVADFGEVDSEVNRLTGLMEFESSTDLGVQAKQFLVSAGLLAAYADGEASEDEQQAIVQLLLQVTGDPEGQITKIKSVGQAEQMLDEACRWLNANAGQERFGLFGQVAHIVAIDGDISAGERAFMLGLAGRLGIPEKSGREILHQVLAGYVRTKTGTRKLGFGFGPET